MSDVIEEDLRDRLRALGYDARLVNGDCFDVHQGGRIHYLSKDEAQALADAGAGLNLMDHAERRGLNYWYSFREESDRNERQVSRA